MSDYPKEIRIEGLTEEQCDMLDLIYACDTPIELKQFLAHLSRKEHALATTLMTLIVYETIELEMIQPMSQREFYPDAMRILKKLKKS